LFVAFCDFSLQRGYRHSAYVTHCEGSGDRQSQGKPFDVTVELPREKKSGFQCRGDEIMLFDWNKDGLETHGDLQFERVSARRRGLLLASKPLVFAIDSLTPP
jgi:hypothetical protein